ncbi:arylsulfatase [Pseudomonas sp. PCH199]|uniref:arylsulfatase n=1 Tax=unclassified Pseudomonas TaxID=196821 RepID=UPI000BC5DA7C|nr:MULTISPECIES: arylsulfatase [unclassified Pseudomonas]MCW8277870.1 arylsulfatase [Pseudomonas sp. PCH199]PAM82029.1 arylsulfatase [Pseudomonas sp. ERMR1:02]
MRINRVIQVLLFGLLSTGNAVAATSAQPNILLILADDLGYSDLGVFGGEINTPSLDALANTNLQLTNMYASPTCSPTRSMLMSGTDNHLAGLGSMAEGLQPFQQGKPGYEGFLNQRSYSMAQLLQEGGYHTLMVGKWHLGMQPEQGPAARGFEYSFTLLDGGGSHFKPSIDEPSKIEQLSYREDGKPVELPDNFYSTDFYTDKLLSYIKESSKDGKPFFAYAAYTSPHWPLQAPDAYLDKYKGRYDGGYDSVRTARIERMKKTGVLPANFEAAKPIPTNPHLPAWEQLTAEQKQVEARKMEIYAAMVDNLDHNVGRLLDYLRESGQYDNTLIIFMSDNGAAGENHSQWYPSGKHTDNSLANLGRPHSEVDYGIRWAEVSAAPFHLFKGTTAEGGISVPAIVKLPLAEARQARVDGVARVDDLLPTFLAAAGLPLPTVNPEKNPVTGTSMLPMLTGTQAADKQIRVMAGELFGNAYYREGNLKLLGMRPRVGLGDAPQPPKWTLYDLTRDRGENTDVASQQPEQVQRLLNAWQGYAEQVGVVFPPVVQAISE